VAESLVQALSSARLNKEQVDSQFAMAETALIPRTRGGKKTQYRYPRLLDDSFLKIFS
jgi:hypothetical protein